MKLKKWILIFAAIIFLFAAYELVLYRILDSDPDYYSIDRCIDSGGCWDGIDKMCRMNEVNAQELCDRAKINGKTLEQRIEEKIDNINGIFIISANGESQSGATHRKSDRMGA